MNDVRSGFALLVAGALATAVTVGTALPAAAGERSPVPQVKISKLSGPTTGPGGEKVYTFEVTARDRDGIITGVSVEVEGQNYHTGTSVLATCAPGAQPGRRFTFQVAERLPAAGLYRATASATSIASCDSFTGAQTSRERTRLLVAKP